MSNKVSPIPAGYANITPYLIVKDAAKAIEFYKKALGATELMRADHKGKICHAELKIGSSIFMLADEFPEMGCMAPTDQSRSGISLLLYSENVDTTVERAIQHGAKLTKPVADQFYGDRSGMIADPFGHTWCISTHIEDVSDAETKARMEKLETFG